jgi:hypothetical protein
MGEWIGVSLRWYGWGGSFRGSETSRVRKSPHGFVWFPQESFQQYFQSPFAIAVPNRPFCASVPNRPPVAVPNRPLRETVSYSPGLPNISRRVVFASPSPHGAQDSSNRNPRSGSPVRLLGATYRFDHYYGLQGGCQTQILQPLRFVKLGKTEEIHSCINAGIRS